MRIVGADGWPKRPLYTQHATELVAAFGRARGYDEHDLALVKPALKELLHEEVASYSSSWRRIWPPLAKPAPDRDWIRQGPGYATDLDEATNDFLRFRERAAIVRRVLDVAAVNRTAEEVLGNRG